MVGMLTTGQVADKLGVSKTTVVNYEDKGLLIPDKKLPSGRRYYSEATVEKFLKSIKTDKEVN